MELQLRVAPVYGERRAWNFSFGASRPDDEHTARTSSDTSISETARPSNLWSSDGSLEYLCTLAS
jgi:hypothetical protein